jgi:hypothetical protein
LTDGEEFLASLRASFSVRGYIRGQPLTRKTVSGRVKGGMMAGVMRAKSSLLSRDYKSCSKRDSAAGKGCCVASSVCWQRQWRAAARSAFVGLRKW